jgi:predicted AAA+ superfamily ATPase
VGKTTGVLSVLESNYAPEEYTYVSCDEGFYDSDWFLHEVQKATIAQKKVLVFDEIQKLDRWSELVKTAWDGLKRKKRSMHLVLLGSSSLQLSVGLNESLAGRFEIIPAHHWSFLESKEAFGLSWEEYLSCGGYPGSYSLRHDTIRFRKYLLDAIYETVVSRDILRYATVRKPALFRQTFALAAQFPAQEVSYNKLLGQLQDAGNVDQIKHYLDLFSQAFLLRLLFKWARSSLSRTSSPKILPCAPVFTWLFMKRELNAEEKGRVFESLVGNRLCEAFESVHFWREGREEVDYVIDTGDALVALEVKTKVRRHSGMAAFKKVHKKAKTCFVDFDSYPEFESAPAEFLLEYSI